jgi:hypothetical protein
MPLRYHSRDLTRQFGKAGMPVSDVDYTAMAIEETLPCVTDSFGSRQPKSLSEASLASCTEVGKILCGRDGMHV